MERPSAGIRTTFFFGAGASAALTDEPVLSSNLLALALKRPPPDCPQGDLARLQSLVTFLSGNDEGRSVPPTDEVLSLIEACIDDDIALGGQWDVVNLQQARRSLVSLIYHFVEHVVHASGGIADGASSAPDQNPFVRMIRNWPKDSRLAAVSLNWDCLFENTYAQIAACNGTIDYGIALKGHDCRPYVANSDALLVLKPHGSLSWGECTVCGMLLLETPPYRAVEALPCVSCGVGRIRTVLVPPTFRDTRRPWYLDAIWARVEEEIRESDRLIFVGYSLPPQDLDARIHLLRGFRQRRPDRKVEIEVVFREHGEGTGIERERYTSIFGGIPGARLSFFGKGMREWLHD